MMMKAFQRLLSAFILSDLSSVAAARRRRLVENVDGKNNWMAKWGEHAGWEETDLESDEDWRWDHYDYRALVQGIGAVKVGDGRAVTQGFNTRYLVQREIGSEGFEDFEISGQAAYNSGEVTEDSGFLIGLRSSFDPSLSLSPCDAEGYTLRLTVISDDDENESTTNLRSEAILTKIYYHDHDEETQIGSLPISTDLPFNLAKDQTFHFKVRIYNEHEDSIVIELYMMMDEGSQQQQELQDTSSQHVLGSSTGTWELAMRVVDSEGSLPPPDGVPIPPECQVREGDPIRERSPIVFFGTDDITATWSNVTVIELKDEDEKGGIFNA